jgi:outer membrane protein OmpA-like peptidoglycan-associated protein
MGQTWKLVFPSDDVFDNDTSEINDNYKPILKIASAFIRTFSTMNVKIRAYTNKIDDDVLTKFGRITDELTTRQAESVLHYMTCQNVNARLLYAEGMGARDTVAWNGSQAGRRLNRRVEISFRYYRDNTAWY